MLKAVFFDFDGVLTTDKTGSATTTHYISQKTGIELSTVKAAFARHNTALTLGKTTHSEIWRQLCDDLGQSLSISLLHEAFESTPLNKEMFTLARSLRQAYLVGIITDNKKDRIDYLRRQHNLDALFDFVIVSAEVGSDKGEQSIFLTALRSTGVKASEAVFIDNNKENLMVPSALGMKTCFHDDERNDVQVLVKLLQELGVAIGDA
ncbi:MAG: HAD-IA family hydrolase [Gammaproteobacteria bacterium]|nr:HAD-IA family hydrolase [Gammaproteobacteria bacterium]MBU0786784.1 HAD-IA family hydrolase [Gammaproteobacteria bacterium]MBU0814010.1 HAD-IA family hydrolase [Gammaproteobacteria bacterium]MBU1788517.1 HAD-IA family hydrolase [Gammaproteobacteria bacterium]